MYSSVFIDMSNFVKSQGVIPSNYHESEIVDVPKCYYAKLSGDEAGCMKDDMIIMENLIPQGFTFISNGNNSSSKVNTTWNRSVSSNIYKTHTFLDTHRADNQRDCQVPRSELLHEVQQQTWLTCINLSSPQHWQCLQTWHLPGAVCYCQDPSPSPVNPVNPSQSKSCRS